MELILKENFHHENQIFFENEIVEVISDIWSGNMSYREVHGPINMPVGIVHMKKVFKCVLQCPKSE